MVTDVVELDRGNVERFREDRADLACAAHGNAHLMAHRMSAQCGPFASISGALLPPRWRTLCLMSFRPPAGWGLLAAWSFPSPNHRLVAAEHAGRRTTST